MCLGRAAPFFDALKAQEFAGLPTLRAQAYLPQASTLVSPLADLQHMLLSKFIDHCKALILQSCM